jgi:hypothetical protein
MTEKRTVDNNDRPAQPEPGEDEAAQMPPVREEAPAGDPDAAKQRERKRQTGE